MNEEKRQRLQAAGWSIGNTWDFLGLTSAETDFIELKLALARRLKQLRLSHQLSQTALAKRMNSSQSRVAKMEAGDPSVSVDLLICGLLAAGATRREVGEIIIG